MEKKKQRSTKYYTAN